MEHVIVAIWGAPDADVSTLREKWVPEALTDPNVEAGTISFAETDQGRFPGPPCDALITLGLSRAHDLDDVPQRDVLYAVAREVNVWRVDPHRAIVGEGAAFKYVSFVRRADGLSHEQFVRHWTEVHAPLAKRHHVGVADYTQSVVRRAYTPGGANIDGIAELRFRTRDDFEQRFYDSDEGRAAIRADVAQFIGQSGISPTLMREEQLRAP
jgi:uncharacterized protein (TIGR02118 family)